MALLCVALSAPVTPAKPKIPSRWEALAVQEGGSTVSPHGAEITWYLDADAEFSKQSIALEIGKIPFNQTVMLTPDSIFSTIAGVCRDFGAIFGGGKFSDPFSWVKYATYNRSLEVDGRQCDEWVLRLPNNTGFLSLTNYGNVPVKLVQHILSMNPLYGEVQWSNETFVFQEFFNRAEDPFPKHFFDVNPECYTEGPICEGGRIEEYDVYRFHEPKWTGLLADQDVGDSTGDTVYTCLNVLGSVAQQGYAWISYWKLSLNTSWGQYAFCNGDPPTCVGGRNTTVGREAAMGLAADKDRAGQCSTNKKTGDWLYLAAPAECKAGAQVGDDGCAWKMERRVKTINGSCLFDDLHYAEACLADGAPPFATATRLFEDAFKYDSVAEGGCPPLRPPEPSDGTATRTPIVRNSGSISDHPIGRLGRQIPQRTSSRNMVGAHGHQNAHVRHVLAVSAALAGL